MAETGTRMDPGGAAENRQGAREQVREQAGQAAEQARGRARGMVDERSTQAGEQVRRQAEDMRSVAQQLREQGKEGPAKLAEQAADRADRMGGYLRDSDADRIVSDVERIARDNPWAVVVGGIALGFAASRFLKASSRERYRVATESRQAQIPRATATPPTPAGAPPSRPQTGTTTPPAAPVGSA